MTVVRGVDFAQILILLDPISRILVEKQKSNNVRTDLMLELRQLAYILQIIGWRVMRFDRLVIM